MPATNSLTSKIQLEIVELASSINDIVDKFKKLHHPLHESKDQVPQATKQLDKISEQTEAVTNKMLDMVEKITQREEEVESGFDSLTQLISENKVDEAKTLIYDLKGKADANRNDAYSIMEALQFQDITTQQMNHAAALLDDLEVKLTKVIKAMNGDDQVEGGTEAGDQDSAPKKERAYDPHAEYIDKKTNQEDIDDIFAQKKD